MGFLSCCFGMGQAVSPAQTDVSTREGLEQEENLVHRSCTDGLFLLLMLGFVISLGALIIYCGINGDIYRIKNGYDACGNICGRKNSAPFKIGRCKNEDKTKQKYLLVTENSAKLFFENVYKICVADCSQQNTGNKQYRRFINRCIPYGVEESGNIFYSKTGLSDFFQEVAEDLEICWEQMLYLCLIAFALSLSIVFLIRYLATIIVWLVLIGVSLASVIGTIYLWIIWSKNRKTLSEKKGKPTDVESRKVQSYLIYAIIATVVTIIILLLVLVMRKRIQLVIQLFKEAGKALQAMPLLLFEPILTFLVIGIAVILWFIFCITIESSGFMKMGEKGFVIFEKDIAMIVSRWYNIFGLFWFVQFVIGCQHMVVAGAVSSWFFTRNKKSLKSPITESFFILARYHLGSVALGSLLIAIIQFIREMLRMIEKIFKSHDNQVFNCLLKTCKCCLWCFEKILIYITRNAYIEIAIRGKNFCSSGVQAVKLLSNNILRVAAINSVGDFILFLGKAMVVISTVLIGMILIQEKEGIQHMWVPLLLVALFTYVISHCFLSVYEMAIDTIFLCFCEDCEQNDGIDRPYYMSVGLMEYVKNSQKAIASSSRKDQAWSSESQRNNKK